MSALALAQLYPLLANVQFLGPEYSMHNRFIGNVKLSNFHRSGECCLSGSSVNQRLSIRNEFQQRIAFELVAFLLFFLAQ